jgi:hypothetical protein
MSQRLEAGKSTERLLRDIGAGARVDGKRTHSGNVTR